MKKVTTDQIKHLAPNVRAAYLEAFKDADQVLAKYAINDSALRIAHFMAQVLHESGGLTIFWENMNYSAERMMKVWPSRFPTLASARPYEHKPRELANKVYNGRMGNQMGTDDGWNFRGRGLLQVTGREDYEKYGKMAGINLAKNPDLAIDAHCSLLIAALEWDAKDCNSSADEDSIIKVTRKINGGLTGLDERREWLRKTRKVWP